MSQPRRLLQSPSAVTGGGLLAWTARILATAGLVSLVLGVLDAVHGGPVMPVLGAGIALLGVVVAGAFVYVEAMVEVSYDVEAALGRVPRVLVRDLLLLGFLGLLALLIGGHGGAGGGGDVRAGAYEPVRRTNFASELIDADEFANVLGLAHVEAEASGFSTGQVSRARVSARDATGPVRARLRVAVFQGRLADSEWKRRAGGTVMPGDARFVSHDRLIVRRADTVVDVHLVAYDGKPLPDLARLTQAIDRRLAAPALAAKPGETPDAPDSGAA